MNEIYSTIPVILGPRLNKDHVPTAVGVITAGQLHTTFTIPHRDFRKKTGYQREVSMPRVKRLMRDLQSGSADLPTALLLNLRHFDERHLEINDDGTAELILDGTDLYVVDGQHRIQALSLLIDQDPSRWESFQLPFVMMLGASEPEEIRQFYVVNSTAKSVRTDLALDLLKQQAESDPDVMASLDEAGESWKVRAQSIVEALDKMPVWQGRIRFPGEPKAATTIANAGLAGSLKGILHNSFFAALSEDSQIKLLDSYWRAIREVLPAVFNDPEDYALQKSTGVQAMHALLLPVLEHVRNEGKSLAEPSSYAEVVRSSLEDTEGDNAHGQPVSGPEFWRSGPDGAAGSYSSNSGRRVLVAKLRSKLPTLEIE